MPSYQLSFKTFLGEIKRWKLTKEFSLYRVNREDVKYFWRFSFCLPNTNEEYVADILKKDLSPVDEMELLAVSIPARRLSENINAANLIINKLDEVKNASQSTGSEGKDL